MNSKKGGNLNKFEIHVSNEKWQKKLIENIQTIFL